MRILQAHNYYKLSGGEDTVVANEKKMLEEQGHEVLTYYRYNTEIDDYSLWDKAKLVNSTTWSDKTYQEVTQLLQETKPEVCHVHNFLPLISPSIYTACQDAGVSVVQTLHNYRLICTNALFLREGKVCEDCLGKTAYHSVTKKCYRNSYLQTYTIARMIEQNKKKGTWKNAVDAYLCFTEFAKDKFVTQGYPADKIHIKPNFVEVQPTETIEKEDYFVYVGRLEENKGIRLLEHLASKFDCSIKIIGAGELSLNKHTNLECIGKKTHSETLDYIRKAKALLFPSLCYEGMPMTILEAFASRTLVIASNLGAMKTMIDHGYNGLLFDIQNIDDFIEKVKFVAEESEKVEQIVTNAFEGYQSHYNRNANYDILMNLYERLIKEKK